MMVERNSICIIGSGSIATSLGNVLAAKGTLKVVLLSIEKDVVESINHTRKNHKYFPNQLLNEALSATTDKAILRNSEIIFLAIPSINTVDYVLENIDLIPQESIIINLAKGFGNENKTIVDCLNGRIPNSVCSLKGPSFAREIINNLPTAMTFGAKDEELFKKVENVFDDTSIYLDFSKDIKGVELLSILKNIYAIAIGIADAHFNSPNLRFMILTRAFKEMKSINKQFGGKDETMFKYCGVGDFGLTALNDLSRNRTLGLLIGKGFFSEDIPAKVLLEGRVSVQIFCDEISKTNSLKDFHIISELYKVFNKDYDSSHFVSKLLKFRN